MFDKETQNQINDRRYEEDPSYRNEVEKYGKCPRTNYNYRITCDVARHGRDYAVIMLWNEYSIEEMFIYGYSSTTELEQRIRILWDRFDI